MPKGIILHTDRTYTLKEFKQHTDYNDAVGGWIEYLGSPSNMLPMSVYLNEEGRLLDLPLNGLATAICIIAEALYDGDVIVGDVAILGDPDNEGNDTDIRENVLELIKRNATERVTNE